MTKGLQEGEQTFENIEELIGIKPVKEKGKKVEKGSDKAQKDEK